MSQLTQLFLQLRMVHSNVDMNKRITRLERASLYCCMDHLLQVMKAFSSIPSSLIDVKIIINKISALILRSERHTCGVIAASDLAALQGCIIEVLRYEESILSLVLVNSSRITDIVDQVPISFICNRSVEVTKATVTQQTQCDMLHSLEVGLEAGMLAEVSDSVTPVSSGISSGSMIGAGGVSTSKHTPKAKRLLAVTPVVSSKKREMLGSAGGASRVSFKMPVANICHSKDTMSDDAVIAVPIPDTAVPGMLALSSAGEGAKLYQSSVGSEVVADKSSMASKYGSADATDSKKQSVLSVGRDAEFHMTPKRTGKGSVVGAIKDDELTTTAKQRVASSEKKAGSSVAEDAKLVTTKHRRAPLERDTVFSVSEYAKLPTNSKHSRAASEAEDNSSVFEDAKLRTTSKHRGAAYEKEAAFSVSEDAKLRTVLKRGSVASERDISVSENAKLPAILKHRRAASARAAAFSVSEDAKYRRAVFERDTPNLPSGLTRSISGSEKKSLFSVGEDAKESKSGGYSYVSSEVESHHGQRRRRVKKAAKQIHNREVEQLDRLYEEEKSPMSKVHIPSPVSVHGRRHTIRKAAKLEESARGRFCESVPDTVAKKISSNMKAELSRISLHSGTSEMSGVPHVPERRMKHEQVECSNVEPAKKKYASGKNRKHFVSKQHIHVGSGKVIGGIGLGVGVSDEGIPTGVSAFGRSSHSSGALTEESEHVPLLASREQLETTSEQLQQQIGDITDTTDYPGYTSSGHASEGETHIRPKRRSSANEGFILREAEPVDDSDDPDDISEEGDYEGSFVTPHSHTSDVYMSTEFEGFTGSEQKQDTKEKLKHCCKKMGAKIARRRIVISDDSE